MCKKITGDSKSYLGYFNKLVDEYNNTYYHSIDKKTIDTDYSALPEEIETNPKSPKTLESGLLSTSIFLAKATQRIGWKKYPWLILYWKLILKHIKLKI